MAQPHARAVTPNCDIEAVASPNTSAPGTDRRLEARQSAPLSSHSPAHPHCFEMRDVRVGETRIFTASFTRNHPPLAHMPTGIYSTPHNPIDTPAGNIDILRAPKALGKYPYLNHASEEGKICLDPGARFLPSYLSRRGFEQPPSPSPSPRRVHRAAAHPYRAATVPRRSLPATTRTRVVGARKQSSRPGGSVSRNRVRTDFLRDDPFVDDAVSAVRTSKPSFHQALRDAHASAFRSPWTGESNLLQ
jgi:hypothetical protein